MHYVFRFQSVGVLALLLAVCSIAFPLRSVGQGEKQAQAEITIVVPADAEIFFDEQPTTQQGAERRFVTPALAVGVKHTYAVRARWQDGGKPVEKTRNLEVTGGAHVRLDFLATPESERRSFAAPADDSAGDSEGAKELKARAEEFIVAFNKGDAAALAAFWTPDGDYVDQAGTRLKGRPAIQAAFEKQFADVKRAKLHILRNGLRFVKPDFAIEDGTTEVVPADGSPPSTARYTAVHVKDNGQWYLASVRDAVALPPSHAEQLEGLEWLIGEWAGETRDGEATHATYSWDDSQNFIVSSFTVALKDVPVLGSTQWIGWDAAAKTVRSWSFLSQGGFTEALWTRQGNQWKIKVKATLRDGKKASATNVITRVDDNQLTWQPTELTVDGKSLPDGEPIKMKRVKAE